MTQHLDPGSHLSEALFGLIMTLTSLGADLVIEAQGRESALLPVVAAIQLGG